MRYCNLAMDLLKKDGKQSNTNMSLVLSHYMFNDNLEEIMFDGLGSYYKIYWIKNNSNLYRCFDGCTGGEVQEKNFNDIIKKCLSHIGGGFESIKYLSFSKSFGRVMLKYFDPECKGKINNNIYNIEIIQNTSINCFYYDENTVTLQEYQEEGNGYENFVIDFSDFYNGRGDRNKEASMKELYEKVFKKENWSASKIGSIYDQEVILYNEKCVKVDRYLLNELEFIIMMVAYAIIVNYNDKKNNLSIDAVVHITTKNINTCSNKFVKRYKDDKIYTDTIQRILSKVDFEYERANKISVDNEGFSDFAKDFISFYKDLNQNEFYRKIIYELQNGSGENYEFKSL